jgi:hypothetical protein
MFADQGNRTWRQNIHQPSIEETAMASEMATDTATTTGQRKVVSVGRQADVAVLVVNDFEIHYSDTATMDQITAVVKALEKIGPGPVDPDYDDDLIEAKLKWGTTGKDLANLKGKLNSVANIVVAVNEALVVNATIDSTYWNRAFTDLIRQTTQTAWGNWSLNPLIFPGAVGIIDPATGSFTYVDTILNADKNAKVIALLAPEAWAIESSSVRQTESEVEFKGGYLDPSSGLVVNVGLDVAWTFAREGSLVSNATMTGRSVVDGFGRLMEEHFDWLVKTARTVGYATPSGGIRQGFGMITHVQTCRGGVNIGSLNENSSFSLVGSIDGVDAMTGGGEVNASVKGSYKETNKSKAFESHMWPSEANTAAQGEIGLTFQFATFQERQIMPTWIQPVNSFRVIFDNAHGGTYIGKCAIEYSVPGSPTPVRLETSVPGGQMGTLDDIPLNAIDLKISIHFVAGDDYHFPFDSPISSWLTGQCTVDMSGVWPWGSKAVIREAYRGL